MSRIEFVEPAETGLRSESYAQAVRVGDRVEISGQGGWTRTGRIPEDVPAEIAQACDNVASVLAAADASWSDVTAVHSFHVHSEVDAAEVMSAELRRRVPAHAPVWTRVDVPMLGPRMHIEVRVVAHLGVGTAPSPRPEDPSRRTAMTRPELFVTPGFGEDQRRRLHTSQAVRVGNRIETSGHGGWTEAGTIPDSRDDELVQTFDNLERTLRAAGASWSDVVGVNSYHTRLDDTEFQLMSAQLRERIPTHLPIWTCIGVAGFGHPAERIQIRVTAVLGEVAGPERERAHAEPDGGTHR